MESRLVHVWPPVAPSCVGDRPAPRVPPAVFKVSICGARRGAKKSEGKVRLTDDSSRGHNGRV